MKVEIWSDVMCPWCYIGKRRFEQALQQFNHAEDVEVIWKSFQLNPQMKTDPTKNINMYLAEIKGWTVDYARRMNDHLTDLAKEVGLHYDFDKAVVANSFDAHRLMQMAKKYGKGDAAEEALFKAYFTEGKNIADHDTLIQLAIDLNIDKSEVISMLEGNEYEDAVVQDVYEAQQVGARGVPFFVFNNKYAVSGAQPTGTFAEVLSRTWKESEKENLSINQPDVSNACSVDGDCASD